MSKKNTKPTQSPNSVTEPVLINESERSEQLVSETESSVVSPKFDRKRYQHDAFGKSVFNNDRYKQHVVEWIGKKQPTLLEHLDIEHIEICPESYLDKELRKYYVDVLYRIPLKNGDSLTMFILIELKTGNDQFTMFQILKYMDRIWDAVLKARKKQSKKRKSNKRRKIETESLEFEGEAWRLPLVLPVIIHHGESTFTAPTNMADLQYSIKGLEKYVVRFEGILLDLGPMSESEMPDDLALGSLVRTMRDVGKKDIDVRLLEMYKNLYPYFTNMPELLEVWEQSLYYAVTSSKHFTRDKYDETATAIQKIRGEDMSTVEKPIYLCDVFHAEGIALGEARGEAKGRAKERAEGIAKVLNRRFEKVPYQLTESLLMIDDLAKLDILFDLAFDCQTLKEFKKIMGTM